MEGFCGGPRGGDSTSTGADAQTTGTVLPTTSATTTTGAEPGTSTDVSVGTASSSESSGGSSTGDTSGTSTGDICADAACGPLDLLLVLDDSPSMAQWQPALSAALQSLDSGPVGTLIRGSCDAHIGVLTTGARAANPKPCQGLGSLVRIGSKPCAGVAPYATGDDDLGDALACRIDVGDDGSSDERPVQALLEAMTPAFNDPGACNDGFFRPDALLVVLFVTDEDDDADAEDEAPGAETPGTPQAWFDSVVAFKGSADRVVMLALTGDTGPISLCPWSPGPGEVDGIGAESPDRLRTFVDLFPRRAVDTLCQEDYAGFIAGGVYEQMAAGCTTQPVRP